MEVAVNSGVSPVVVVLGANADLLQVGIKNNQAVVVINNEWKEGMASSIQCGLKKIMEIAPSINAVIIMVCDQPFVSVKLLHDLIRRHVDSGKPIIASSYKKNRGTPALFHNSIFAELLKLKGDTGARKILKENPEWVAAVDFPLGEIDIDTEVDYKKLLQRI